MKLTLGCIRRADEDFGMIAPGDCVAVGVSGGKDSLLLLRALALYRYIRHQDFTLKAIMLTTGKTEPDTSRIEALCREIDVPLTVRYTDLYQILFEQRKEENPCALCAKMRRGMLCDLARDLGCAKLALGHHREDVLETLLMSTLFEGRFHTFHPVTPMSRSGVTVIRPMVYLPEKHVIRMRRILDLPVLENPCPANGHTMRQEMKELLADLCRRHPTAKDRLLHALWDDRQYSLWEREHKPGVHVPTVAACYRHKRVADEGDES